jgi:hypothetical protein
MTKDEKAEDYDRLQYEFTQIGQDLKSEKRANKKLQEQLLLHNVSQQRELLIAFQENFYEGIHDVTRKHIELGVDKYLSNL